MLKSVASLHALKIGFAAALSRLEETHKSANSNSTTTNADAGKEDAAGEELAAALQKLDIMQDAKVDIVDIITSSSFVDLLNHRAVKYVHGDVDGDVYLENLIKWSKESRDKIKQDGSEIPSHLPQGDLYRELRKLHSKALF